MTSARLDGVDVVPGTMAAIVVATAAADDGTPAALLTAAGDTLLSRLCAQLDEQGAGALTVLTRPEWATTVAAAVPRRRLVTVSSLADTLDAVAACAQKSTGAVVLAHGEILTHDSVLTGLVRDPRVATGVVSSSRGLPNDRTLKLRIERGRVVAAESAYHSIDRASGSLLGLLKVSTVDRASLVAVAAELAELCRQQLPPAWESELAAKVQSWGLDFFRRHGAVTALADQLERLQATEKWLPDPAAIRNGFDAVWRSELLQPAAAAADDVVALLVTGLVRNGTPLTSTYLRELFWSRPFSQQRAVTAMRELTAIDEERVLLESAVKASDGFFTTFFVSPYSKHIARWCAQHNLTPNQVTTFSMGLGVLAAAAFAVGTRLSLVTGALLLHLAFTFDCVDGQLARYTRQFSKLGAWLDSVFDRAKEYVVFVGLALGATRVGAGDDIWLLAAAALTLQTVRHTIDFSYAQIQHTAITETKRAPLSQPQERGKPRSADHVTALMPSVDLEGHLNEGDVASPATQPRLSRLSSVGRAGVMASRFLEQRRWLKWAKRILVLPIGERFALISITAAVFGPRTTFVALLTWGSIALLYTLTGRILRSVI